MAILTDAQFVAALKVLYAKGLEQEWYEESPFLAWIRASYDFTGRNTTVVPHYGGIRGGTKFGGAQAAKSTPALAEFTISRSKDFVIGSVDNEVLAASKGQKGAIAQALKTSMDSAIYEYGRSQAFQVWSDGSGVRGTVGAPGAGTLTLTNRTDIVHFEIDMWVEVKSAAGVIQTGYLEITGIDEDAGTITYTLQGGAVDPIATDLLARYSDFDPGVGNSTCMHGVLSWIPIVAPTPGDNFGSVDRSAHVTRLAGIRFGTAGGSIEEKVFNACARAKTSGAKVDTLWMHPDIFALLTASIQGKAWYSMERKVVKSNGGSTKRVEVGFSGFVFPTPHGPVVVMCDPNMPVGYGLLTRKEAWECKALRQNPHYSDEDGRTLLRETAADAMEYRLKGYRNLLCHRPHDNVLITW